MPTLGVAIPCYHGHINILKNLLDSIEKQTRKPDMVVVSCSSSNDTPYTQDQYSFPLKIITNPNKMNTAQNRNIAASILDTDIISFIDADDQMHFQRLEIIEKVFENDIVMLIHSFITGFDKPDIKYDNIVFDINKLGIDPCGWMICHLDNPQNNIHNGHVSIHKKIFNLIKYNESPEWCAKEDSLFNSEIIKMFPNNTAYCPLELSKYIASHSNINI